MRRFSTLADRACPRRQHKVTPLPTSQLGSLSLRCNVAIVVGALRPRCIERFADGLPDFKSERPSVHELWRISSLGAHGKAVQCHLKFRTLPIQTRYFRIEHCCVIISALHWSFSRTAPQLAARGLSLIRPHLHSGGEGSAPGFAWGARGTRRSTRAHGRGRLRGRCMPRWLLLWWLVGAALL